MSGRMRLAFVALIAVLSVAAVAALGDSAPPSSPSRDPGRTAAATAKPGPLELPEPLTHRDHSFDPRVVSSPTASKAQSKLWYANGTWWGLLHEPVSGWLHIYRLAPGGSSWIDTGTLVDERPSARADAIAVGEQLYVAAAGPRAGAVDAIRLSRFTLRDGRYELDIDYPIRLNDSGVEAVVLARDATSRLWIAYTSANRVWVRASDGDDHHWGSTFTPAVDGTAVAPDDIAAVLPFGDSVGLMWSNQREDAVYFSAHRDRDPVEVWSPTEVVSRGIRQPDDHINMKADEIGRVYAVLKTSLDTLPNANPLAPQIMLAVRDLEGGWHQHVVARVKDHHTRPIVLIDEQRDMLFVVATSPATGGSVYYKRSSLEDVSFETGVGTLLIGGGVDKKVNNATSTKQSLAADSDMVVLASDNSTGRYLHGVLGLGGPALGSSPPSQPPAGEPQLVVNDAFDSWRNGEPLPMGWVSRNVAPGGASVQARGEHGRVGRVAAITDGPPPRVCRQFAPISAGRVLVTFDVRARGSGRSEAVLALIRGAGGDAAQVRFGSRGTFTYVDGNGRTITPARWKPDVWYRVTIDLDVAARSTTLAISDEAGDAVLRRVRAAWPHPASSVDEICFQASAGAARPSLEFDALRVTRVALPG